VRILYFTRDFTPHDHRFLASLAGTEHEVFSLRLEHRGQQLEDRSLPPEVTQLRWAGGQDAFRWHDTPRLLSDLRRVLKEVQPDVVHAGPIQNAALLAALAGAHPLVSMTWGYDLLLDADRGPTWRWATRFALSRTTVLLGDCRAVSDKAEQFGFPPGRAVLFPWGIDLERFSPGENADFRARRGWGDEDFVLLSLRSWEPLYGIDVLAQAFVRAARQEPRLRLMLLGTGSQAPLVRKILLDGGVEDWVFFGGRVSNPDLPGYYRAADLYISTSHTDGSSVSLMEALGCGCPALVSDIPGNREWITPGEQGWLFPDGDDRALAEGMLEAAVNRDYLPQMGAAARELAEQRADWERNFQTMLSGYEMACTL
jgi:glycosyltransferase involved in cell wall biosynthesis